MAHAPFAHVPFARSLLLICHCSFTIHCSPLLGSHPPLVIDRSQLIFAIYCSPFTFRS
jgi:hypothetical protein